jgi:leucyl-tRNA---protein transferase
VINNLHIQPQINGMLLDQYLEYGWYRMSNSIFTTDSIDTGNGVVNVYWARYIVNNFMLTKKLKDILNLGKAFTVSISPLLITAEMESLYTKYKASIDFDISPTLLDYLNSPILNEPYQNVFETYAIQIEDANKLIAYGIVDNGLHSIAGIVNVIDPDYKRYSLGKFLMLQKMDFALQKNKRFYYPGYISDTWNKFDYKLFIGKPITEIYERETHTWLRFEDWNTGMQTLMFVTKKTNSYIELPQKK